MVTRTWELVRREGGTADITEGCMVRLRDGRIDGPVQRDGNGWGLAGYCWDWWLDGEHEARLPKDDITHVSTEPSDE